MKTFKQFLEQIRPSPEQMKNLKIQYQYKQATDAKPLHNDPVKAAKMLKKI